MKADSPETSGTNKPFTKTKMSFNRVGRQNEWGTAAANVSIRASIGLNHHEGSIPFTRSIQHQALTSKCK